MRRRNKFHRAQFCSIPKMDNESAVVRTPKSVVVSSQQCSATTRERAEVAQVASTSATSELEAIYRQHCSFVWRNARRLGCSNDLADDVVHEVFLVVARRLSEFRHQASLPTWLFAITYRVVKRMFRDRARHARWLENYAAERPPQSEGHPHAQSDAGECLRYLLSQLDETKRAVFILSELEGMTSVEIGACLGVRPATIDSRLRAARLALIKLMECEHARERSNLR